ncbi:hypothetical protein MWU53_10425 [Aliiroseovarius sp. S1123]|jgi:hypothetical protein|uniref:hypothetical protein n=1 Tax=Aliiroseovarius sp. S1123 TaxID=2926404 RepID=UPI001FF502E5|nr:hypothetical protein [Aliiroseovarius sp. S1123]MCK0171473.1 hypothetical protein [Aliiroseovarius sp. S1123]
MDKSETFATWMAILQGRFGPDRVVVSIPEGGAVIGLGRTASYTAAKRGDLPTIKINGVEKVSIVALAQKLDEASNTESERSDAGCSS